MSHGRIVNVASVPQRSPFRYPGGKTWLVPQIRKWMRSLGFHAELFIEPFAGGGIVSLTVAFEEFADHVIIVELDPDVSAVWKTITSPNYQNLSDRILRFDVTKENVQRELSKTSTQVDDIAFRTILKNRMFHGGILAPGASLIKHGENGKGLRSRWYPKTLANRINAIGSIRERFTVIEGDGIAQIRKHHRSRNAVFFIDPPYTADGKKAGKRLYCYNELDHVALFDTAKTIQGDLLMTYDDAQGVRELAQTRGFDMEIVAMKNTHHAKMIELLIGNDLEWARAPEGGYVQQEFVFG
uniref:DNA adenine methylase n=1 Tax=Candidatus Kentrum sp. SD TaxID=2126332 RepID=A0A450YI14_9GAMM|nr:MAG: DNA adenine methylase [Candidatus Kentron sp. SD]VFK41197.1 MAG: DNA adenine methylase [Candidatus Kentron sp. SD]VFK78297.1 MAG: DNA adenine methylase [Candidatus Kentron sp. SD]